MSAKKKKRRMTGEVELNLAAMLDMAFQLLTFFILTFKPAPVEGDVLLHLPPAMPTTQVKGAQKLGSDEKNTNPVQGLDTLMITVAADESGTIRNISVGTKNVSGVQDFEAELQQALANKATGFQQILVQISANLYYQELMQIIDACTRQKLANGENLKKLSFVQLPGG